MELGDGFVVGVLLVSGLEESNRRGFVAGVKILVSRVKLVAGAFGGSVLH